MNSFPTRKGLKDAQTPVEQAVRSKPASEGNHPFGSSLTTTPYLLSPRIYFTRVGIHHVAFIMLRRLVSHTAF